jgi:hypothetical protein
MDTTASETGEDESDDDNDSTPTPMEYAFLARVLHSPSSTPSSHHVSSHQDLSNDQTLQLPS